MRLDAAGQSTHDLDFSHSLGHHLIIFRDFLPADYYFEAKEIINLFVCSITMKKFLIVFTVVILVSSTVLGMIQGHEAKPDKYKFAKYVLESISYRSLPSPHLVYLRNDQALFSFNLETRRHGSTVFVDSTEGLLPMNTDDIFAAAVFGTIGVPTAREIAIASKGAKGFRLTGASTTLCLHRRCCSRFGIFARLQFNRPKLYGRGH